MSLLVDLFANDRIMNSYSRDLHHLSTKPVDIGIVFGQNIDSYKLANEMDSDDVHFHKTCALAAFDVRTKTYDRFCGVLYDLHHELAKLNIILGYNTYVTIISLEDSLDYVLHSLCGCSIENIRSMPNYTELSRALLKLNFGEFLNRFSIRDLIGVDPKLDSFIASCELESRDGKEVSEDLDEDEIEEFQKKFLQTFITKLITKSDDIIKYLGYNYKREREDAVTVKSKSACSFILSSKERFCHDMVIRVAGCDDYTLIVRSFERYEYSSNIHLPYAK